METVSRSTQAGDKGKCIMLTHISLFSGLGADDVGATKDQIGAKTGLKLHPDFVLWMQGLPLDYLD